jgi:hypothetical protein
VCAGKLIGTFRLIRTQNFLILIHSEHYSAIVFLIGKEIDNEKEVRMVIQKLHRFCIPLSLFVVLWKIQNLKT